MSHRTNLELDAPREVANWRPLVHWFLAIPHLIIAGALGSLAGAIALVTWLVVLVTGALPEGLANLQCMIIRYQSRTYSYVLWLREDYPAFDFTMTEEDPGGDPLTVTIYPQLNDRNRLTVALRFIWAIPYAIFAWAVGLVAGVCALIAFFAVLSTGRWPEGLRDFVVGSLRVGARFAAYAYMLDDTYPPFSLES